MPTGEFVVIEEGPSVDVPTQFRDILNWFFVKGGQLPENQLSVNKR